MFRWLFVSLLLSACGVTAVWLLVPHLNSAPTPAAAASLTPAREKEAAPRPLPEQARQRVDAITPASWTRGQTEVFVYHNSSKTQDLAEPIIIPDGTLVIVEKQQVPSAKEGIITMIGTLVKEGEVVSPENKLPEISLPLLAIPVGPNEKRREGDFRFPNEQTMYRQVRPTDNLEPNKLRLFTWGPQKVRKLRVGDRVKRGDLVAVIEHQKEMDDVAMKIAKIDAAEAERAAAEVQEKEFSRRYQNQININRRQPGTIGQDALQETYIMMRKHEGDKKVKEKEIESAQRAVSAAFNDLKKHEIYAAIDGEIKTIYKNHQGEATKPFEPILEIQNPGWLRVEGRLELQEALKLQKGMTAIVEASRPESPRLILSGHLAPINCVAVSKGKQPVIVSGSEDETLRGWDAVSGAQLWQVQGLRSAVRAVACTPPSSQRNLACFGCADGSLRLLDLDKPEEKPRELEQRHRGPVLAVAFRPDGEVLATCGDDHLIHLWNTETGVLLHTLSGHSAEVTSIQYASTKQLVSAGKDGRLIVWDVEDGKPPHSVGRFDGRGGEVLSLGVSPDGKTVLFDQGKEIRLLTLEGKHIVGTLRNPSERSNFSTVALFSPDGKTILTNRSGPGELQLWRTPVTQKRGSELRQLIWSDVATCGAFAPEGEAFVVTGTQDHKVLVWAMPKQEEIATQLNARLTLVEKYLDTQSRHVRVWAELNNPGWLIPGMRATMVVLPPQK